MKRFEGKTLLLLGSNVGTLDIIRYAKENGAYTIVADNLPVERSFGKQFADDNVLISTADLEGLERYIKENEIDKKIDKAKDTVVKTTKDVSKQVGDAVNKAATDIKESFDTPKKKTTTKKTTTKKTTSSKKTTKKGDK